MDVSAYINSTISAFQKVVKPLVELFKLKSEVTALRHENQSLKLENMKLQDKVGELEQRCKELEAPEHAQKLGYPLCRCTIQPQIMHQISPDKFKCGKCGAEKSTNSSATFSEPKWHS